MNKQSWKRSPELFIYDSISVNYKVKILKKCISGEHKIISGGFDLNSSVIQFKLYLYDLNYYEFEIRLPNCGMMILKLSG
jgi:hypothetical protein